MFKGKLYPFQQEAADYMVERGQLLLALVMGAGKTVTTIAALESLLAAKKIQRSLIVVPSALKYQWAREITKFTDSSVLVVDGDKRTRTLQWKQIHKYQYVVVNPETLVRDLDNAKTSEYGAMVIDEATMIKTPRSQRSRHLKRLGKKYQYRFALTGQPIENRPEELFSIMQFVDPSVLGDYDIFDKTFIVRDKAFGKPIRYRNLRLLNEAMSEAMIRKTREDIADQLPKVLTTVVPVPFDPKGAVLYKHIARELLQSILKATSKHGNNFNLWSHYFGNGDFSEDQGLIMSQLTTLRMLCDNPALILKSAALYDDTVSKGGSQYASELVFKNLISIPYKTPKLDAVVEYITNVLEEDPNSKVVLFSFFKHNLSLIQQATKLITQSVIFSGDHDNEHRDRVKQQFMTDPNTRLFLSSDAGGYGLDLPIANYLISYDLPWSAGKLDQRESRIIRLSSQHPYVNIVSFVMKGSIEERQYEMLQSKRDINKAFVDKGYDQTGSYQINLSTLSSFLQSSEV